MGGIAVAIGAALLVLQPGIGQPADSAEGIEDMSDSLVIGQMNKGQFEELGTIVFEDGGSGELSISVDGDAAARLQSAWDEMQAKDELVVRRTRRVQTEDGGMRRELLGIKARKGEDGYPQAVIDYLSSQHGYFARPTQ